MELTLEPNAQVYNIFISTIIENESTNIAVIVMKKRDMTAEFAYTTINLIRHKEFALFGYCLNLLHPFSFVAEIADEIGKQYGRILWKTKIKFHVDQIKIEFARIYLLVRQGCWQIKALEGEIKDVERLEEKQIDEIRILKWVYD